MMPSQPSPDLSTNEYVRRLEDACLILWGEMPKPETLVLRSEFSELMDFLAHLHHQIDHEQAMVRRNVWASGA